MASIINASTAGVGGVITTADNSGILNIQTAGTTAITVNASQNVGVGVTPSAWATFKSITVGDYGASLASAGDDSFFSSNTYYNSGFKFQGAASAYASAYRQKTGVHSWLTSTAAGTAGNAITFTQAMTLDASGNLNVGTTGVNTNAIQQNTNAATSTLQVIAAQSTTGNQYGIFVSLNGDPNNTTNYFMANRGAGSTDRCTIRSNGGIANYSANNVNLSDRREKTNFAPAGNYLDKICAIPVQTFNYNDQNLEEDDGLTLGVVAQDVQAVCPEMVMESNWAGEDEPEKLRLSVYQTDLQYALMKSIQELKAIVDTQAEQIKALQGAKVG